MQVHFCCILQLSAQTDLNYGEARKLNPHELSSTHNSIAQIRLSQPTRLYIIHNQLQRTNGFVAADYDHNVAITLEDKKVENLRMRKIMEYSLMNYDTADLARIIGQSDVLDPCRSGVDI